MASSDCFVSVVAPLHDDADIVREFLREVVAVLKESYENYEIVLVDDGSTDATARIVSEVLAEERCIRLILLSRGFGGDIAISAGLDSVIGDFVVVLMPEKDPPELIPQFVEKCRRGVGIAYGIRARRPTEPFYLTIGTRAFYWYFNRIIGVDLPFNSTDYRAYSRQTVNAITRIHDRLRYLRTFGAQVGFGGWSSRRSSAGRLRRPTASRRRSSPRWWRRSSSSWPRCASTWGGCWARSRTVPSTTSGRNGPARSCSWTRTARTWCRTRAEAASGDRRRATSGCPAPGRRTAAACSTTR